MMANFDRRVTACGEPSMESRPDNPLSSREAKGTPLPAAGFPPLDVPFLPASGHEGFQSRRPARSFLFPLTVTSN